LKKGNFKGPYHFKGRLTPKKLHAHIWAMLNKMDEDEQQEFFDNAEEEGFY